MLIVTVCVPTTVTKTTETHQVNLTHRQRVADTCNNILTFFGAESILFGSEKSSPSLLADVEVFFHQLPVESVEPILSGERREAGLAGPEQPGSGRHRLREVVRFPLPEAFFVGPEVTIKTCKIRQNIDGFVTIGVITVVAVDAARHVTVNHGREKEEEEEQGAAQLHVEPPALILL